MIWKNPSEHVTGKIAIPSLVKFWVQAFPKLQQNPGIDVEEAEVDLGVLQVRVVGKLRHDAVAVAERELDVIGGAFDVL